MNWKEIKKKYPKAYDKCARWLHDEIDICLFSPIPSTIDDRLLYDFFDDNEIHIEIGIDMTMKAKYAAMVNYIETDGITWEWNDWQSECLDRTRQQAEIVAFEKAFEIFENELKQ